MSAKLSSADKFVHYKVLAILGLLINVGSILVAAYISYLQSSMNYLFFSCLEVAILSVLMIVFAIAMTGAFMLIFITISITWSTV